MPTNTWRNKSSHEAAHRLGVAGCRSRILQVKCVLIGLAALALATSACASDADTAHHGDAIAEREFLAAFIAEERGPQPPQPMRVITQAGPAQLRVAHEPATPGGNVTTVQLPDAAVQASAHADRMRLLHLHGVIHFGSVDHQLQDSRTAPSSARAMSRGRL